MLLVVGDAAFGAAIVRCSSDTRVVPFGEPALDALREVRDVRAIVLSGLPPDPHPLVDEAVEASARTRAPILHLAGLDGLKVIYGVPLPTHAPKGEAIDEIGLEGRLANLIEDQLQQHVELSGVPALVLRAGDLFGPGVTDGSVPPLLRLAKRTGRAVWPAGPRDLHAFTFVDDVADVALRLLDRGWGTFAVANVGEQVVDGEGWAAAVSAALGKPHPLEAVAGLRLEVRRLWDADLRALPPRAFWEGAILLDDTATRRALPDQVPTPLADALRTVL